jgi:hypothetical protein
MKGFLGIFAAFLLGALSSLLLPSPVPPGNPPLPGPAPVGTPPLPGPTPAGTPPLPGRAPTGTPPAAEPPPIGTPGLRRLPACLLAKSGTFIDGEI